MDTLRFLQRVLPPRGLYVIAIKTNNGMQQGFFGDIEKLANAVESSNKRGYTTYYAISSFKEKGSRKRDNVHSTKVIAADIDCGEDKPYADAKEALVALGKFVQVSRLPRPMIVFSGVGIHVYWRLNKAYAPEVWKPYAEAMKKCAIGHGLDIDPVVTADVVRILRPVGTTNDKSGNPVKLLHEGEETSLEELSGLLPVDNTFVASGNTQRKSLLDSLQVQSEFPPSNAGVIQNKCKQVKWAADNQEEVPEPIWYDLIGIAAYCHNPEQTAKAWSYKHPGYDEAATVSKLQHWKDSADGPTTCDKFEADRPGGCKGCPFKGKIGSPARLGVQYQTVDVSQDAPDTVSKEVALPKPFKRANSGIKVTIDDTDIDVCDFDIYPVSYGRDETLGYEVVRYHWRRPHVGWQELCLRQAYLVDGSREFPQSIADQGIVLNSKNQTEYFQMMLRSYMNELRKKRAMTNLYSSMGWKENFTEFVLGNTLFRRLSDGTVDEEEISLASTSQRIGSDLYSTCGSLQYWVDFTELLEKADLNAHKFGLGVSLATPLFAFTGLKGVTLSLYGETGGGKTLLQLWMQSIYGNPEKLHFSSKFTANTLFSRMGLYGNLPLTIDEVTLMSDRDVGDFIYWVSQGRDKARLNRNAEERATRDWATTATVSTNRSLNSKLTSSGLETEAQMMRLMEVTVPSSRLFTKDNTAGKRVHKHITTNYGLVGREVIRRLLAMGESGIRAMIAEAEAGFSDKYDVTFSGEERYWEQLLVMTDLMLERASEWGLIKYDPRSAIEWALREIDKSRESIDENKVDCFDVLSEYLNSHAGDAVTVMHTGAQDPQVDMSRLPREDIRIRFDVYRSNSASPFDKGTVLIDRNHFRKWLSAEGSDYRGIIKDFKEEHVLATPRSNRAYLGKDTPIKVGQCYVIGLNLNHPRLHGILDAAEEVADNLTFGQLQGV